MRMADSRRCALIPQLGIEQILLEAQHRWLRPSEVCEILRNYQKFCLSPDPPYKPPGGSLFLFDRKALRYFRKDGHRWRKKKDGKTVREAHEKLKAGSVDVLHCYYAHGEDNENFQRRSYWMLDGQLEHIVLVHYREVKEGNRSSTPRLLNAVPETLNSSRVIPISPAAGSLQTSSPVLAAQPSYASSPSTANWNGQTLSPEHEDADSGDDFGASSLAEQASGSGFQTASLHSNDLEGKDHLVCKDTMSNPYLRGLTDSTVTTGGSLNPYCVSQVPTLNLLPSEGLQADHRTSQEAGLTALSRNYHGTSYGQGAGLSTWSESFSSNRNLTSMYQPQISFNQINDADVLNKKLTDYALDPYNTVRDGQDCRIISNPHTQTFMKHPFQENHKEESDGHAGPSSRDNCTESDMNCMYQVPHDHGSRSGVQYQNDGGSLMHVATNGQPFGSETDNAQNLKNVEERSLYNEHGELKKLDSFGRWMNNEIGKDCDDSLMGSDSCNYWNTLEAQNDGKEVSSLSTHMQFDVDSLGPSLSQVQLFSILDFSPDWGYSGLETKILISGSFLGGVENPNSCRWCCMFGEIEVPAEVLATNTLRCLAPAHVPGRVPFYITCSNRLACSEVREFEYREKPPSLGVKSKFGEEVRIQVRFARMLFRGVERKRLDCSLENCKKCSLKKDIFSGRDSDENDWSKIEIALHAMEQSQENSREELMQKLLKDRLYEWLVCKAHEEGKGPSILDDEGQGLIHMAAALGYVWAISPIVAAGVSPSFRDTRGWTGLHWAAYFGREETVVELLRLGAAPGAVEDPTSKYTEGRTAADIASNRGHKGIAGYLAEAHLTSHLSSLGLRENVPGSIIDSLSASDKAVEAVNEQNIISVDGNAENQLSLKGSLAAVRNSAQAAARIQAAFRINSFRQRQSTNYNDDSSEISSELIAVASLSKPQKVGHFSDSLHAAAVRIQQKYRGWKGRKEFLKIRNRIVKIQAHVRGHQVRKQYKKVVWSVSIVEKAILRWRRKGAGLRGFRADRTVRNMEPETGKTDDYDFLRVGRKQKVAGVEKALARVQSMVRYPEGRDQYMRLVTNFQNSKMLGNEGDVSGITQPTDACQDR